MSDTPCIVLAGGFGTRLASELGGKPKCLAPINGTPFLQILLEQLASQGVSRFVLSLGHLAEMVVDAVRPLQGRFTIDCIVEPAPLGTGGALLYAMQQKSMSEILAVNGDTFIGVDLGAMLVPLDVSGNELMRMAAFHVDDRARYGGLLTDGAHLSGFLEKGTNGAGAINGGFYRLRREVFGTAVAGSAFSLERDILPSAVARRAVTVASLDGAFIDIGVPEDYRRFCQTHV